MGMGGYKGEHWKKNAYLQLEFAIIEHCNEHQPLLIILIA
jgi:hypothetical protein